jgi:predicted acetyltransferase
MGDVQNHEVTVVGEDRYRDASDVFLGTLHRKPLGDNDWGQVKGTYEPGRMFGVFDENALVGTTASFSSTLRIPGGAKLPAAAVTRVGVRADHTRQGIVSALLRTQLTACRDAGESLAVLWASEAGIYGRFGYGIASRFAGYELNRNRARPHDAVPSAGRVRVVAPDEAAKELPRLYRDLDSSRPGTLTRSDAWWSMVGMWWSHSNSPVTVVVHADVHGVDDGFAVYSAERAPGGGFGSTLSVWELRADRPEALGALWRYLLGVDLVDTVTFPMLPLDVPVDLMVTDPRALRVTAVNDELWLRIVDVPAALAARGWGVGELVIDVTDPLLAANSGHYRVSGGSVELRLMSRIWRWTSRCCPCCTSVTASRVRWRRPATSTRMPPCSPAPTRCSPSTELLGVERVSDAS